MSDWDETAAKSEKNPANVVHFLTLFWHQQAKTGLHNIKKSDFIYEIQKVTFLIGIKLQQYRAKPTARFRLKGEGWRKNQDRAARNSLRDFTVSV